jgi:hypothetical protein
MTSTDLGALERMLSGKGPGAAIDELCRLLRDGKDYGSLFYALLMKKRQELGVNPIPTGPSNELPAAAHAPYEEAIREAGRLVGQLYLGEGNIPQAYAYFRMLGEPQPVAEALEKLQPGPEQDIQPFVQIAFYEGVRPQKGFDWILERFGLCSSITTLSGHEQALAPDDRRYCVGRLARALYRELTERLAGDIERREGKAPPAGLRVRELMAGRDWLFDDEFYHVDVSHLSSVVQLAVHLEPGEELEMVREMCAYGQRLSTRFQYASDPPFEDRYKDYGVYFSIIAGDNVEEGIAHFRAKAENADPDEIGTYPAEVLVNLLLRLNRTEEALEVARRFLSKVDNRQLSCPSLVELCQRTKNYAALAEMAREQGDPVHFLAGLIAAQK